MSPLRLLVFLAVVTTVSLAVHRFFWVRLVRDVTTSSRLRRIGAVLFAALALSVPAGLTLWRFVGAETVRPVSFVGATWAGVLFLLLVCLLGADLLRGAVRLARRKARPPALPVDLGRRRFLARSVAGVAGAGAAGLSTAALVEGARPPEVVEVTVPVRRLPAAFHGFRIAQLSDVHVGPLLRRPFLDDLVRRTNALAPDLVAITGDLVDGSVDDLRDVVAALADLRAPHGVWFTTGNHEYYMGADPWIAHLATLGVRTLRNTRVEVTRGGAVIDLAGIDDPTGAGFPGHGPDLDRALEGRDPARPVVLLAHQPKQVFDAERLGVDVQLSGHTHGGQIAPFGALVRLVQPAVAGLHRFGPTWLYVSRGAGSWGPPMRLGNPAELTVVTLRPA
ncbi:MAG: metallophosphoesterase [Planctomycetota bacterium]